MDEVATVPWDALHEAVGRLRADRLWPQNVAMRRLLGDAGLAPEQVQADSVPFVALPLGGDERRALLAGEPVWWTRGERHWQLRRVEVAAGAFLLAEDTSSRRAAESQAFAAARARSLAAVAGTFVHDLNNHLNLALALLSQVRGMGVSADDARLCDELGTGAQLGATLSRALARLLARESDHRERVDVGAAVGEAIAAIAKTCAQRGIPVDGDVGPNGVVVRASAGELGGMLLQMLLAATDVRPQRLAVRVERVEAALAGGRERSSVRLHVDVATASAAQAAAFAAAALDRPGCLRDLAGTGHHGQALAHIGLVVRRLGGEFTADAHGTQATLVTTLPLAERN
jgi:signal transduction histidine kinase